MNSVGLSLGDIVIVNLRRVEMSRDDFLSPKEHVAIVVFCDIEPYFGFRFCSPLFHNVVFVQAT